MDFYNRLFSDYKQYIVDNSIYEPRVVKYTTQTSTYFPIVTLQLSNSINTDYSSLDFIEKFDEYYFTIDIYAKNKTKGENIVVASQEIIDELTNLTIKFFEGLRMKRTLCRPTPNLDTNILRQTIQYQCMLGNARENIIRR